MLNAVATGYKSKQLDNLKKSKFYSGTN